MANFYNEEKFTLKQDWNWSKNIWKGDDLIHQQAYDSAYGSMLEYLEIESEVKWNDLANTDICKKWWKYMSDIMPANPDYSPKSDELHEVFRLT